MAADRDAVKGQMAYARGKPIGAVGPMEAPCAARTI
ncbi:MAG: hypothetical protein JWM65_677 [Sphingomonas bacterium]|nr:hypothetical protein [Sphingomonas bacterium]